MAGIVLALDLATTFGWCVGAPDGRPAYGSVRLDGRERPARYAALMDWLDDARRVHRFARVVYEAPLVRADFRSADGTLLLLGLAEHLESWGWECGVPRQAVSVGTTRKAVLGRGTFARGMAKPTVLDWCRREGFDPRDDNAADAILLWAHATGYRRQREMAA